LEIEHLKTQDLAGMGAPYNPRQITEHDLAALRRSMKFFGVVEPVVVNRRTGRIVGGHQRVKAAEAEGIETLPVVTVDLDEPSEKQLNLALNRISGDWDEEALARVLAELQAAGADLAMTGFKPGEIEKYLASLRGPFGPEDDEAPDLPKQATTKPGDLWELGEHRVLCGDSTDPATLDRLLEQHRPALLITDPPYGVEYVGKTRDALRIQNDDLGPEKTEQMVARVLGNAFPKLAAGAAIYLACPAGPNSGFQRAMLQAGFEWHQTLIWRKDQFVLGRSDYHYQHEPILYGWKPGKHYFIADRTRSTVLDIPRPKASRDHPTMKPVALWAELIGNSTTPSQEALDPFLGSGTTVVACERLGRRAFGVEVDPRYVDVVVERWQQTTGRKATRKKGGAKCVRAGRG
jgi:DNA modification methylase